MPASSLAFQTSKYFIVTAFKSIFLVCCFLEEVCTASRSKRKTDAALMRALAGIHDHTKRPTRAHSPHLTAAYCKRYPPLFLELSPIEFYGGLTEVRVLDPTTASRSRTCAGAAIS